MSENCRGSRKEAGCLRFDLLREKADTFISYEAFESTEAIELHKEMAYTKAWGAFQYGEARINSDYLFFFSTWRQGQEAGYKQAGGWAKPWHIENQGVPLVCGGFASFRAAELRKRCDSSQISHSLTQNSSLSLCATSARRS